MSTEKKIWKFLSSMRFAIVLLVILAAACALASLITQGQDYSWYAARYSERTAALIIALRLDDAFHSPWFIAIAGFLCLNLMMCNVVRLPRLVRRARAEGDMARALAGPSEVSAPCEDPEALFRRLRMPAPARGMDAEGHEALFACKNRAGLWGAWVCHLGILLLILGFALGQMTQRQTALYGVPGQTRAIEGTSYMMTIDDFTIGLRDDDTVEQYTTAFTLHNMGSSGPSGDSAEVSVNNPAQLYGLKFYQNSTGWAATVSVEESGAPLQSEVLCAGEYLRVADKPDLVVMFNAFYPDYVNVSGRPQTASGQLNNPAYLYSVYYMGEIIGMDALMDGEVITIDDYVVTFTEPRPYTLIQIKEDHFAWLALIGALVTLLGLALAFYVQPAKVWAIRELDGWVAHGVCRKGGALFRQQFERAAAPGGTKGD